MKLVRREPLIEAGAFANSRDHKQILKELEQAVHAVVWPHGSHDFAIYPESGKKRGEGNGVVPIKDAFVTWLTEHCKGWESEQRLKIGDVGGAGKIDVIKRLPGGGIYAVEWETGNVSSSHRSLNKLALGIVTGILAGGTLIIPTRVFAAYLTDRIGNFEEIAPYFPLWREVCPKEGALNVIAVEHDRTDKKVRRIAKGTDGRALL